MAVGLVIFGSNARNRDGPLHPEDMSDLPLPGVRITVWADSQPGDHAVQKFSPHVQRVTRKPQTMATCLCQRF